MSDALEPLGTSRRAEGVFEQLRSRILSGAYPAGSRIPNERDLAEVLRVNRASVREAVKRLEFLELVEVRHGQGTYVLEVGNSSALQVIETLLREPSTITTELLRQLLEFRRHVTTQMIELAVRNRRPEHVLRARKLLAEEEAAAGDPKRALEIDLEMNTLIGEASGNLMYQLLSNLFTKLVARLGPLYYNAGRDHRRSHATHRALLGALEQQDAAEALRTLGEMLDYSEGAILRQARDLEAAGMIGPRAGATLP
jgi:GntR family transcriptional repressor for pyruvate dehydrogenase complex